MTYQTLVNQLYVNVITKTGAETINYPFATIAPIDYKAPPDTAENDQLLR